MGMMATSEMSFAQILAEFAETTKKLTQGAKTGANGQMSQDSTDAQKEAHLRRFRRVRDYLSSQGVDDMAVETLPGDWLAQTMLRMWEHAGSVRVGERKGMLLIGAPGNGKTTRMRAVADFFGFPCLRAAEMVRDVSKAEYNGTIKDIANFPSIICINNQRRYDLVIDDLGTETPVVNNFGTRHDYMEEIITERYEALERGAITHFATNLTLEQLRERYGRRIYSRLEEMTVPIGLPNFDRRSTKGPAKCC